MEYLQIENNFIAIVLTVLAVLFPVIIILWTLRRIRKKRERRSEKPREFGKKFQSVKEERAKKSGKYKR